MIYAQVSREKFLRAAATLRTLVREHCLHCYCNIVCALQKSMDRVSFSRAPCRLKCMIKWRQLCTNKMTENAEWGAHQNRVPPPCTNSHHVSLRFVAQLPHHSSKAKESSVLEMVTGRTEDLNSAPKRPHLVATEQHVGAARDAPLVENLYLLVSDSLI